MKKHTEQAQRISDVWDPRDFRTLWLAARVMLSCPCGPKRRRYDIPLSSLPTAAARAKVEWKHSYGMRGFENNRRHVGPQQKVTRWNWRNLRRIFVVWCGVFDNHLFGVRLRVGRLQANFGDRLWIRCVITLRRNME